MAGEGLEDMIAGKSAISTIDGKKGVLTYRGISIHEIADHSTFEETTYLLWYGRLPKQAELAEFCAKIWKECRLPAAVVSQLKALPSSANPMSLLRTGVSLLGLADPQEDITAEADKASGVPMIGQLEPSAPGFGPGHPSTLKSIRLMGQLTALVAAIQRLRKSQPMVEPAAGKSLAYNFLLQLSGNAPDDETVRIFDKCLILHADHEFNASTFTARVAASTLSDVHSAVVAAVAALKGPLHGGANTEVMKMLLEVRDPSKAREWVKAEAVDKKKKIMGFGHRMYKGEDPRATHLRKMSEYLCGKVGKPEWYQLSKNIEDAMQEFKNIKPNVDFYSASTYYCLGIDPELYTPIFAMSRVAGWIAHILEQQAHNRIMRPVAEYVGGENVPYVPIEKR